MKTYLKPSPAARDVVMVTKCRIYTLLDLWTYWSGRLKLDIVTPSECTNISTVMGVYDAMTSYNFLENDDP